jgi:hypothetical protein
MNDHSAETPTQTSVTETRKLRLIWWLAFVLAPTAGVIVALIVAFVVLRLPLPFTR